MWADHLTQDQRTTVAMAVGRVGELVGQLNIDHVEMVATMVQEDLPVGEVLLMLRKQVRDHEEFIALMRRIQANLETVVSVLERAEPEAA